jgi:hypothetical protein
MRIVGFGKAHGIVSAKIFASGTTHWLGEGDW